MSNPQHPPCALCGSTAGPDHPCPGLYIGRTLDGRYQIESVLGMGGMGMVFRALQVSMKRAVALKTLHPSLAAAPQFFERFRREAETASRLKHPNIITVFDFGRAEDNTYYFVMELVDGESLKQLVKREGPMSLRRAFYIIEQCANGLVLAHQEQVVHRDIKPHNILVSTVNKQDFVKILDFGLVKAMEQGEEEAHLTSTGQVLGTPQYMPPEQAGGEAVDARSDLYSLTGVLHFCLTGSSPFGANTVRKALQAALTQQVPSVASKRQGAPVSKAVEEFIRKGLAGEKIDRHQLAEEFLEELRAAVSTLSDAELDALPFNDGGQVREAGSGSGRKTPSGIGSKSGSKSGAGKPASNVVVARELDPNATLAGGRRAGVAPSGGSGGGAGKVIGIAAAALILVGGGAAFVAMKPKAADPAVQVVSLDTPQQADKPSTLAVTVTSNPAGADVFEGETYRGKTPLKLALSRELHPLIFKLEGHKDVARNLDLASIADEQFNLAVDLQPVPKATPVTATKPKKPAQKEDIPIFE